jgi:hypothetical protein
LIALIDSSDNQRVVKTTGFGYYRFDDIAGGGIVTLSVSAKKFSLNQRSSEQRMIQVVMPILSVNNNLNQCTS